MAVYGDLDAIKLSLRGDPQIQISDETAALLERERAVVSSTIDEMTGRKFGVANGATDRLVYGPTHTVITFDRPAISISGIQYGGRPEGATVVEQIALDAYYWTPDLVDEDGLIWGIRALYGVFGASDPYGRPMVPYTITAVWADEGNGSTTVPADIDEITNYITCERFKAKKAGPSGQIGPNGEIVPIRNPFKDTVVMSVIQKYSLRKMVSL